MTNNPSAWLNTTALLTTDDPNPVDIVNPDSACPVVLVCEHAGNLIPNELKNLGLTSDTLKKHIAWDIGAENTARKIANQLGATLVIQKYSRLVIDCNRPPKSRTSIPTVSDNIFIEANKNLSETQQQQRVSEIFEPYQAAVTETIARPSCKIALSIHSYTRKLDGCHRPWDIGFLYRKDALTSLVLAQEVSNFISTDRIGMNEPYRIADDEDWFVPMQGEASAKHHSLIEICNDLIDTPEGQEKWATLMSKTIQQTIKRLVP